MPSETVSGIIKWFDPGKGFGFVQISEGKDALLRAATMREAGVIYAIPGAAVTCSVVTTRKGLAVTRIHEIDQTHETSKGWWERGVVKWFSRINGYGFVAMPDGRDAMLHATVLRAAGIIRVEPDEPVLVQIVGRNAKRVTAIQVLEQ